MNNPMETNAKRQIDRIQQRLASYAHGLNYDNLTTEAIHAAKVRTIDTLGALVAGFFAEPSQIARNLAARIPDLSGATVIGTRNKTTVEMAAFTNATTARYVELTDSYHWPGSYGGHPSDVITPVLAIAEREQSDGRKFITAIVLAYEVYLRISDRVHHYDIDHTNFACLGGAAAAGKLMDLSLKQISHCISMAAVPNVVLRQVRAGQRSMFKATASGQAARSAVFSALLARAGMEGPHLPFEGKAGWCDHAARERFSLDIFGGDGVPFKIMDTFIKNRSAGGSTLASVLAAEKIAPVRNIKAVKRVVVEVHKHSKEHSGMGAERWNPTSKETADGGIPYTVAVTLMDGTLTPRSYSDSRLRNPELHALMQKIEVVENKAFTEAYEKVPMEHRSRVTVWMDDGEQLIGEAGGDQEDMAMSKSDTQINDKFRGLTEDILGTKRVNAILDLLWHLEDVKNMKNIPAAFIFH